MKRVSIRDVAKAAGVSITTVSKALNNYPDVKEETKKRIQELVEEMNYVPNQAGRSMGGITDPVIGLLINNLQPEEPSGAVYGFMSGVCHACKQNGIDFLLLTCDDDTQNKIPLQRLCLSKGLDGLVCTGFHTADPYMIQLRDLDIPCASIDIVTGYENVTDITIDNEQASAEAINFLLKQGWKNIAMLLGDSSVDVSIRREQGARQAMYNAGLSFAPGRVLNGDFSKDKAYILAKGLIERDPQIDAFFCISDLMALGVCRAIEECGLMVGKDIAVVGFDDIPIAGYVYGGLTTIHQDFYSMGYQAGEQIFYRITSANGNSDKTEVCNNKDTVKLLHRLVIRGTAPEK